jgi:hypothetical protein
VVGRELHTMCPHGEDHPGHDCQKVKELGLHSSRGPNMTIGSKNSKPTMMRYTALNWIVATHKSVTFRMNCVLQE